MEVPGPPTSHDDLTVHQGEILSLGQVSCPRHRCDAILGGNQMKFGDSQHSDVALDAIFRGVQRRAITDLFPAFVKVQETLNVFCGFIIGLVASVRHDRQRRVMQDQVEVADCHGGLCLENVGVELIRRPKVQDAAMQLAPGVKFLVRSGQLLGVLDKIHLGERHHGLLAPWHYGNHHLGVRIL